MVFVRVALRRHPIFLSSHISLIDLRKAHQANDRAVMEAYGFAKDITETEIVAELFKMYSQLAQASK